MNDINAWGKLGLFAGGVLFGTAGIKVLAGRTARCVYTHATAATLRAKDEVTKTATIKENTEDILADTKKINERMVAESAHKVIEDTAEETPAEPTPAENE